MIRTRRGAIALELSVALLLLGSGPAHAQDVTGKITGRVVDKDSGQALSGVTVIVQGPQGDDATLTDAQGDYYFSTLPGGTYVIRFYVASSSTRTEQGGVIVSPDKTVRVNARIAGQAAAAAAQETYVIARKSPAIDIGATRLGPTFDSNFTNNVPVGRNFGDVLEKAPGAFLDRTGSVSIGGATGLENIYLVDGLNVTGIEFGNINSNSASLGGGSNFPVEFLDQLAVNTGGYNAEFGGAMGGVVSAVTKSGSNELHGSVFGYWQPYFLAAEPTIVNRIGGAISSQIKPDFDTTIGVEVGGPIIKNKLFFWGGFAPRFEEDHVFRITNALVQNADGSATAGPEVDRRRITEPRKSYHYGLKVDFVPAPDHKLTLSLFGSPSYGQGLRSFLGVQAIADPAWARETVDRNNTDVSARWVSKLYDRKWQIEANVGFHKEAFNNYSPTPALNSLNQQEWWGANLWDLEHTPGCEPVTSASGTFQPCPVDNYHNGGFGLEKKFDAQRWSGEVKSTHLFDAGGHHELKYGIHAEATDFNQDRYYSGPLGSRAVIAHFPTYLRIQNFFSLQTGVLPYQAVARPFDLQVPPAYQDHLKADVSNFIGSLFLQDSYSVRPNLTFNVGARYEMQNMYDFHGAKFLGLTDIAPRIGVVFDPSNEGHSKIFAHYGQYFEAIPMSIASRYFGGEGIVVHVADPSACTNPPANWTGNGAAEWKTCAVDTNPNNYGVFNNGSNYPVQPHLKGQFHSEVVAGAQHEVMEDLVLGVDFTHRWLGSVIEDGTAAPDFNFILANPGNVPPEAITASQNQVNSDQAQVTQRQAEVDAATTADTKTAAQTALANAQNALGKSQSLLSNLQGLAAEPKPERTYDALTLFVDKRFSRRWLVHASYTYSRLVGNYEGLYQDHQDYFAPNGSNAYDTQDLVLNTKGRLPNDHPHSGRVDGYYTQPAGKGSFVFGLGFAARSGQPREYMSNLAGNGQIVFLLPRGSGGRTPPITEFDGKFSYRRPLTDKTGLELFIDVFNIINQQATLRTDDDYTFDSAAPIVNGTKDDLKYAKNGNGGPLTTNPNYGRAVSYQAPIHGRLGFRLTF
jgi:Carboxypeptidase regulatory-like domain